MGLPEIYMVKKPVTNMLVSGAALKIWLESVAASQLVRLISYQNIPED